MVKSKKSGTAQRGKTQPKDIKKKSKTFQLDSDFSESGYLPSTANHVIIRNTRNDLLLDFCYVDPLDVEKATKANKPSIPVLVVNRISLSPSTATELAKNLKDHLDKSFKDIPVAESFKISKEDLN